MSEPFIGEIRIFPYTFAPRDWALCNGQTLNINEHQALYAILGTTYGGDGRVTFNLPNLQTSVVVGPGGNIQRGMTTGSATSTLIELQIPSHTHQILVDDVDATLDTPSANTFAKGLAPGLRGSTTPFSAYSDSGVANQSLSPNGIGSTGGSQAHENRQPFVATHYCIALLGLFPSRN